MNRQNVIVFFALHLCIAVFFVILGMEGFLFKNSDVAMIAGKLAAVFGGESGIYVILISILEIVCGVVMLVSLISPVGTGFLRISILVSMILWLTVIILKDIIGASVFNHFSIGALTQWLRMLILDVVLLLSIWTVRVRE